MTRVLTSAVLGVAVSVALTGCSGSHLLSASRVDRAFSNAGLYPSPIFRNLVIAGVSETHWDSRPRSLSPSIVVEIFPSVQTAKYVVTIGGNEETIDGVQIRPVARVENVVVTLYADATKAERAQVQRAVATLRKG
jgi:hypothetical protein